MCMCIVYVYVHVHVHVHVYSKKIVYSKPNNCGPKNYCVALSGPPLGINDYSLAPPTRRLQNKNRTEQPVLMAS
jgi:hypothetical protein